MRLIGSKTENEFRKQMINSHEALFNNKKNQRLLDEIQNNFPLMKTAYILGWTPEQGEDIYLILINDDTIATFEIDRYEKGVKPIVSSRPLKNYLKGLSRSKQVELAVAIDLAKEDLNNYL